MATITLKGNPIHISGALPAVGSAAPDFALLRNDLSTANLAAFVGKKLVLNIFPSIDTPVCAISVRQFNEAAAGLANTAVLNISADLPFAQARFCGAEGIANTMTLSTWRSNFGIAWGVEITDGPLAQLCARAVVVLDAAHRVIYTELVPEIAQEPNYAAALAAAR